IGVWDVAEVTDMKSLFGNKGTFNTDINAWDTAAVTNMQGMFAYARYRRRGGGPRETFWNHVWISPGPSCCTIKSLGQRIQPGPLELGHGQGHEYAVYIQ
ncbi:hypothetical protein M885DRAFT_451047, partial [Pelagophyceae sp. CCMP2097]